LIITDGNNAEQSAQSQQPLMLPSATTKEISAAIASATRSKETKSALEKGMIAEVTRAEIIWSSFTTKVHMSQRTAAEAVKCSPLMFPKCESATKMQLQRTKLGYAVNYGLGPHFSFELRRYLEESVDFISVGFDESQRNF